MNGGAVVVRALERAGVEVVFGLPGVHNLAIWRALADSQIRLVGVRHEQAAAYAADGYARASGKPGVALVTTGPGAANTLGATGEAIVAGRFSRRRLCACQASTVACSTRPPTRPRYSAR